MTVSTSTSSATYTGNAATVLFAVPFYFLVSTDLVLQQKVYATGVVRTLILGSDYTLTGAGVNAGGAATLAVAPAVGDTLYIARNVSVVQNTAYPSNSPFPAASHEMALDRLTMIAQQEATTLALALTRSPLGATYDLTGNTLINVANGVNSQDAVTLSQAQQLVAAGQSGIIPGGIALYAALAASNGASLLGYTAPGTGAVSRPIGTKEGERLSIFDYMTTAQIADTQLSTPLLDHTAAFQAHAAACATSGVSSTFNMPKGNFNISADIVCTFSGVVQGSGTQDTIVNITNATSNGFTTVGSYGRIVFRDFAINATVTKTAGAGILLNTTSPTGAAQSGARIQNVTMTGMYQGFKALNAAYWVVSGCTFYNSISDAIYADCSHNFDAGDNSIGGGTLISGGTGGNGIHLINNCRITDTKILGHNIGILVQPTTVTGTRVDTQIGPAVSIENQSTYGIQFASNGATASVANFIINGVQLGVFPASARGIALFGNVGGFVIINCLFALSANASQFGISIVGNGDGQPGSGILSSNVFTGGSASVIAIYAAATNLLISDNQILTPGTSITGTTTTTTIRGQSFTFANLPSPVANGSLVYCVDGTVANPVAAGGTGCFAKRLNGVWVGN